jgi:hypothetical protein
MEGRFMAKNGTQTLKEINVGLPPELIAFLERAAEADCRSIAGEIRFFITETMRRAGKPVLAPFPPPLFREGEPIEETRERLRAPAQVDFFCAQPIDCPEAALGSQRARRHRNLKRSR